MAACNLLPALLRHITWEEDAVLAFLEGLLNIPGKPSESKLTSLILGASFLLPFPRASLPTFPSFPAFLQAWLFQAWPWQMLVLFQAHGPFFEVMLFQAHLWLLCFSRRCFSKLPFCCCHWHQGQLCFFRHFELFPSPPAIHGTGPW